MSTPYTARVTRRFKASPERVFDAWLDPTRVGRWLFATKEGTMMRVEIDARPGGSFVIVERRDGEDVEHTGSYLEIDRPRRLVFTLTVAKYSSEVSRVTVEIAPVADGCEVTLTHEMGSREYVERTRDGWTRILAALASTLE